MCPDESGYIWQLWTAVFCWTAMMPRIQNTPKVAGLATSWHCCLLSTGRSSWCLCFFIKDSKTGHPWSLCPCWLECVSGHCWPCPEISDESAATQKGQSICTKNSMISWVIAVSSPGKLFPSQVSKLLSSNEIPLLGLWFQPSHDMKNRFLMIVSWSQTLITRLDVNVGGWISENDSVFFCSEMP